MIRSHGLDLIQAADVLKEYLDPKLETALIYADIPDTRLDAWSGLIRKAILHHGHDLSTRSIALPALFSALEVLPLREHACLPVDGSGGIAAVREAGPRSHREVQVVLCADSWSG